MSEQNLNHYFSDDISLKEIIDFLTESWKGVFAITMIVFLGSVGYLIATPYQYEAIAQIQVAQIGAIGNATNNISPSSNSNANSSNIFWGSNVEDPNLLIARLKLPTTYSMREFEACGLGQKKMPAETLIDLSKFSIVKGAGAIIEFKVRLGNKESAIQCAQAVFENIRESQYLLVKPYIQEAEILLKTYEIRLKEAQEFIARADESRVTLSVADLANRDEIRFLGNEISRLNAFIYSANTRQSKLVSPIYASERPVYPDKNITLILALISGVFIGFLFMLVKRALDSGRKIST